MDKSSAHPERIGSYAVRDILGRGGQGTVYLCWDPGLEREVAVKVIHHASHELVKEARLAAKLSHENIVTVFEFNADYPYLVMEYCADGDLDRRIKSRRPIPLSETHAIVRQILLALEVAHEHQPPIVHRDIKPQNVLFKGSKPKVTDFGLGKMTEESAGASRSVGYSQGYGSPEQVRLIKAPVGPSSDLWAVGVILYELLTFQRPFERPNEDEWDWRRRMENQAPADPEFALPPSVWQVIVKSLEKIPERRFGSAAQMRAALEAAIATVADPSVAFPPEGVLTEADRLAARISSCVKLGQHQDAESLLSLLLKATDDDQFKSYWKRALRKESGDRVSSGSGSPFLTSIDSMLARFRFDDAKAELGRLLLSDPTNPLVEQYFEKISALKQQVEQDVRETGRAITDAQLGPEDELRRWEELAARYPGLSGAQQRVDLARGKVARALQRRLYEETDRTAGLLLESGDFTNAIAVWDDFLRLHPDDVLARGRRDDLAAKARAASLERRIAALRTEVKKEAAEREAAGDLEGAWAQWQRILRESPSDEEARATVADLGTRREALEKSILRNELQERSARLEARLRDGGTDSAPEFRVAIARAVQGGRDALGSDALPRLREARDRAAGVERDVLVAESKALATRRSALVPLVGRAIALADASAPADGTLVSAIGEALAGLAVIPAGVATTEAIRRLGANEAALRQAVDRRGQARAQAVAGTRGHLTAVLAEVERKVSAIVADGAAADQVVGGLRARVAELRRGLDALAESDLPVRIDQAEALLSETEMAVARADVALLAQLDSTTLEAWGVLADGDDPELRRLAKRAGDLLRAAATSSPEPDACRSILTELGPRILAVRAERERGTETARKSWEAACRSWDEVDRSGLAREAQATANAVLEEGKRAAAAGDLATLDRAARRLGGIATVAAIDGIRERFGEMADRIEMLGPEGAPGKKALDAVRRLRSAIVNDDPSKWLEPARALERFAAETTAAPAEVDELPEITSKIRKFNQRHNPRALERYEQAREIFSKQARGSRAAADRTKASRELRLRQRQLLRPTGPAWRGPATVTAAILIAVIGGAAIKTLMHGSASEVRLIAESGTMTVSIRQGESKVSSDLNIDDESGATVSLSPGEYEVVGGTSVKVKFKAPVDAVVVPVFAAVEPEVVLWEEMNLDSTDANKGQGVE